jgi:methionyl aminopeptidase
MINIKTPKQIAGIGVAGTIAAGALDYLAPYAVAGVTTDELNNHAREWIEHHGAICAPLNYKGYPKETCISVNECICHGIPSNRELVDGDIFNVDVTAIKDGFYGDTSRMYTIGEVSQEAKDLIDVTKECLNIGISQVYPDNHFGNIGYAIGTYAQSRGYSVVYQFCGHGTGVDFHEEPNIPHIAPKDSGALMKPGMVFTIEPMINIGVAEALLNEADGWTATTADGKLSAQFEHTLVVTEDGYKILT